MLALYMRLNCYFKANIDTFNFDMKLVCFKTFQNIFETISKQCFEMKVASMDNTNEKQEVVKSIKKSSGRLDISLLDTKDNANQEKIRTEYQKYRTYVMWKNNAPVFPSCRDLPRRKRCANNVRPLPQEQGI